MKTSIVIAAAFFSSSLANATPASDSVSQRENSPYLAELEKSASLPQPDIVMPKIGGIIGSSSLIWGESIGWINLRTAHADLKIGSNILAGWIWFENCGWVCLGNGLPLDGRRYSNHVSHDWGINNDGYGNLSGYVWSEVTGWISCRTGHSRVYLDETGQFHGYAWGENVGWMHFGPGSRVRYLAKADPGPWKEIGPERGSRFAGGADDSEMRSGYIPVTGLNNNSGRYTKDAWVVCSLRLGRDDSFLQIRRSNTPVLMNGLAKLSTIRAPPSPR